VVWHDKLQYILQYDEEYATPYPDRPDLAFCTGVLGKKVDEACNWKSVDATSPICSDSWFETGGYCHVSAYGAKMGIVAFLATILFVSGSLLHDLTELLHIPLMTTSDSFFFCGIVMGIVVVFILPTFGMHYESLVEYQPPIFKFIMLPTIVFNGSYHANPRALFVEFNQTVIFGLFGTLISCVYCNPCPFHEIAALIAYVIAQDYCGWGLVAIYRLTHRSRSPSRDTFLRGDDAGFTVVSAEPNPNPKHVQEARRE
jgi:hypothetical protein